ncbi:MAG: hypothetical protein AAGC86_02935 [Pseudomonadota bacterium]
MNPAFLSLAFASALFASLAQAESIQRLDRIGHAVLPLDQEFDGAPIVGI